MTIEHPRAHAFFTWVTRWPKFWLVLSLLVVTSVASFLPSLTKDSSIDAFIPADHPSLIYRDQVKEIFGLADPMVVAVVNDGPAGIFNPASLQLVQRLSDDMARVPGIDPDRITSLATESDIIGTEDSLLVDPFWETPPRSQAEADAVRAALADFELYQGNLVARDGSATLIVAELLTGADGEAVYDELATLAMDATTEADQVHVAGEGAVSGVLGYYIASDAVRLNPLVGLLMTLVLIAAYRTIRGVVLPNILVLGAVVICLGSMAGAGVPFYVITSALPVILIAIAVADAVHILGQYYEEHARRPDACQQELVVRSMVEMWRPVVITSLTDAAGFLALAATVTMPPMRAFGIFAALGSLGALLLAVFAIPAALMLVKPRGSPAYRRVTASADGPETDIFGRTMMRLGELVARHPRRLIAGAAVVVVAGLAGALQLRVNDRRIENFAHDTSIWQADEAINARLNGTNHLDIVIETPEVEGLFDPDRLRRIEALQTYMESLPHVSDSVSIVDYLKQMNRALNEDRPEAYVLPDDANVVAEHFLLYSASGEPTDFEEQVDYDYRMANVRVILDTGLHSDEKFVVETAERYISDTFNAPGITASLAGQVNVHYHWIKDIGRSHFIGVAWALLAVGAMAALLFRSAVAGLLAVIPVTLAVLVIYAVMGAMNIYLSVGTSMFAAIAIGTGVDFAVHTLDRLIVVLRDEGHSMSDFHRHLFPSTGRALFFNFTTVLLGFGVLTTSSVPPLVWFGILTGVAICVSFLGGILLVPALILVFKPRFLRHPNSAPVRGRAAAGTIMLVLMLGGATATAQELPTGREIAERINARDTGEAVSRILIMRMTNRRGQTRMRETFGYRKDNDKERRTVVFYTAPSSIKDTAFLTYDYRDESVDDDQWLYLPATRKIRRISASHRGDYFLGTDLTYEDIKLEGRVSLADYTYTSVGEEEIDGHRCYIVQSTPVSDDVAKELGYGGGTLSVDAEIWMVRKQSSLDVAGNPLKTVRTRDIRLVDGIWTAHTIDVENHKTGHRTVLEFSAIDYAAAVDDNVFTQRALRRGIRAQ